MADDQVSEPPLSGTKPSKPVSEALLNDKVHRLSLFCCSAVLAFSYPILVLGWKKRSARMLFGISPDFHSKPQDYPNLSPHRCLRAHRLTVLALIYIFTVGSCYLLIYRQIVFRLRCWCGLLGSIIQTKSLAGLARNRFWSRKSI